jgi:bifunctional non-homologous end joining protein LigD
MLMRSPLARERRRPAGFIKPCQPTLSDKAPSGPLWLHEIKVDGYRIIACKSGDTVRLWSRNGRDWSREFLAVTEALAALRVEEIVLDGEAMAHCQDGWPDFHGLRSNDGAAGACLFAFDLLRLNGEDLRPLPLEERRARLRKALRGAGKALRFSEHLEGDGEAIFRHACALGLEGIVSKRRDIRYRSGRSLTWLKIKNPTYERR